MNHDSSRKNKLFKKQTKKTNSSEGHCNIFCSPCHDIQDHFGLDNDDILKTHFHWFRFFRIGFVLQRYERFACRPFMTNMCARVEIAGNKHKHKQNP
ncbi:hypothetical protein B1H58_18670 [Pantoea alhagi]|uniref:Uncharacterized protein n=1 Tax=Pantoea alhagi TaxID=1891675 RepID=A0A1W6B9V4_9GAMM|nr:DUF3289 family protein [Pantoea alhagi]ARJ43872.1 hypothetical protein B1H58_18670 [Pantoea alhagi]